MSDFVDLEFRRNRGWPWPEDSSGRTPMFGVDGWCHACGVPQREQCGSMVLQRRGLTVAGVWVPNWRFDTICLERDIAVEVAARFRVELREVGWPVSSPGDAMQIVIPSTPQNWFDEEQLRARVVERHGSAGARCDVCGIWRWLPLTFGWLPPVLDPSALDGYDIVASPEWFGDGWSALRQILVRRELAEFLRAASPRDFVIGEVVELTGVAGTKPYPERKPGVPVPAGAVSEIFVATLLPASSVDGEPAAAERRAAVNARATLERAGGLVSANALVEIANRLFDGGEVEEAVSLWHQAAKHGSTAASEALHKTGHPEA